MRFVSCVAAGWQEKTFQERFMSKLKKLTIAAICIALCVVLPMAFHMIPNAGSVMLPMHIPVLLCGLVCGWPAGFACGLLGPLLSSLLTGMPPAAVLPSMMVECAVYGLVSGLMLLFVRTKSVYADLYISMTAAMLAGRILGGAAKALVFAPGSMTVPLWMTGYFVTGLPGIAVQLAVIPSLVFALMKAKLIPRRYSE